MVGAILVDSTVLIRLVTGEQGADFAVNLLSRAEEGVEDIVIPSTALYEMLVAAGYAAASAMLKTDGVKEIVEALRKPENREAVQEKLRSIAAYFAQMIDTGRIIVYSVTGKDVMAAAEKAAKTGLTLRDALTLVVAERLGIQKIATFSKELREKTRRGYTFLPTS